MERFKEFGRKHKHSFDNQNYSGFSYTKVHVFQYYSDLHIEHQPYGTVPIIVPISDEKVNYEDEDDLPIFFVKNLILAGDIGNPLSEEYWNLLKNVNNIFDNVFLICGNHEYYNSSIDYINRLIKDKISIYNLKNVHFLNNSTFMLDSIRVIGSTMWSFIPENNKDEVTNYLNDYRLIEDFNVDVCNDLHKEAVTYIENELSKTKKSVVITHHAPTFENSSAPIYKDKPTTCAFASSLEHLVNEAYFWVYGHTHYNGGDGEENLKSNQLGYNWTRPLRGFNPDSHFVIHSFTQY